MTTALRHRRIGVVATVIAATLVGATLAACSPAGHTVPAAPSTAAVTPASAADTASTRTPDEPATTAAPTSRKTPAAASETGQTTPAVNALGLTGPSVAETVPDMRAVISDPTPTLPATVTDAHGTRITVRHADRVIALDLYGTLTDTVIGLGLGDRLVGRGVSDTQESLKALPVVSQGGIELNAEAVLALQPDVILTNLTVGSEPIYRQLESAGITVVRFATVPSLAEIPGLIEQVGAAFGMRTAATTLAQQTEQRLTEVRGQIAALQRATPRKPRAVVLYVRGTAGVFFILGADYGAADLLRELGVDDAAADHGITGLTPANAESLVALDPEIVLTMTHGVESAGGIDGLLKRPGMSATTAGAHRRIVTAADSQLLSYGPRTPDNLLALARAIYTGGADKPEADAPHESR